MIGTLIGGLNAVRKMKKVRRSLSDELRQEIYRHDAEAHGDATRRADARQMLTELDRTLREHTARAAGTAAVAGGIGQSTAVEKAAATSAIAEATAQIARQGVSDRRRADEEFARRRREIESARRRLLGIEAQQSVKAGSYL